MAKNELKTASVLAFERKIDPSDALFSAGRWNERNQGEKWTPIKIREKSVRGTISNRLATKDQDQAKLDASIQSPNLQTVDVATLPNDSDTLRVRFTLRILGGTGIPSACNNAEYQEKLHLTVKQYINNIGFSVLAHRYAVNLANARFLWRNRISSEQIEVQIRQIIKGSVNLIGTFDAQNFALRDFNVIPETDREQLQTVAQAIDHGLTGSEYVVLEIIAYARMGAGQEVYPSQELILDRGDKKGQKSKTLYAVGEAAAIHSQKIGNAIRTIDTWYPNDEQIVSGPIAVEPYGSVTSQGKAYRQPKQKADFYSLLDNWVLKNIVPDEGNQHYVLATLIRGGVFGEKE